MVVVIDNYDSFVHNLARYVRELGHQTVVVRNDAVTVADVADLAPRHIIISPGPCTPAEAGVSVELIEAFAGRVPILGVCLGHQCIAAAFGGRVVRARHATHGKSSLIRHGGTDLFHGIPNPFRAGRYHSLAVELESLPASLQVLAVTADDRAEIMALRHRTLPVWGVQFHPESVLTRHGHALLANFLAMPAPAAADGSALAETGSAAIGGAHVFNGRDGFAGEGE
ncbi:MAG TPA: aminodeoxychorismate/anthranilate synthase component II [Longimicrobiales bacterium]|nr:aminodeoxychorismate/anthranilate synthase component II [Longimicrobiales bacterium]